MTDRKQLAARARQLADQAGLDRRAWLSVSVLLSTTTSNRGARNALADIRDRDIRDRSAELLDQLLTNDAITAAEADSKHSPAAAEREERTP